MNDKDLEKVSRVYEIYKLRESTRLQVHKGAQTGVWEVAEEFLTTCALLTPDTQVFRSIETGMGLSSVVFSNLGWDHTAIAPSLVESNGIFAWIKQSKSRMLKQPRLIVEYSYVELAKQEYYGRNFDFALIDGNHAFPHVFLDYFYFSQMVKVDGYLAIDDINLPAPKKLFEYTKEKSYWQVFKVTDKWAILKLIHDFDVVNEDWDS